MPLLAMPLSLLAAARHAPASFGTQAAITERAAVYASGLVQYIQSSLESCVAGLPFAPLFCV
jgi:hypothetical protein